VFRTRGIFNFQEDTMKKLGRKKASLLATAGLVISTATACGASGRKNSGANPPPAPQKPDSGSVYFLDADALTGSDMALTWKDSPVVWSYHLVIDGESIDQKTNVSTEELRAGLASHPVKGGSRLSLELSIRGKDSAEAFQLLATNVEKDTEESPVAAAIWSESCQSVSPDINILDDATVVEKAGKKLLRVEMKLCDFARILVAPTVGVKPAQYKEDPRLVVYECAVNNLTSFYSSNKVLYAGHPYQSTCMIGYTQPASDALLTRKTLVNSDGSARPIEIPAGENTEPFTISTGNDFLNYLPNAPAAKRYQIVEENLMANSREKLPLGRMRDCHTLEIQTMYKDPASAANGTAKESRLTFTQTFDANDQTMRWVADNQTVLPAPQAIYAAAQPTVRYWLHCTWQNTLGVDVARVVPGQ
jgi:hypothetical protein